MSIAMILTMAADGHGDRVAIGSREDGMTYPQLRACAAGLADEVAERGAERLALAAPNNLAVPAVLFGAAWAGLPYAPVNTRLPTDQVTGLLKRVEPAVVVADAEQRERLTVQPAGGLLALEELSAFASTGGEPSLVDPAQPAVLLFTSGTTSEPKIAVLRHTNLLSYVLGTVEFASANEDEAALVSVPPFHIAGVSAVLSNCYAGRRIVPLARFDAETWVATARAEAITHAFLVPTMLARIVEVLERDGGSLPSLQHVAYGGAKMPLPVIERALQLLPNADFVNAYGLTETSSTVAVLGPDEHREALASADPAVRARLRSVGRAVPGVEFSIRDEHGTPLAAGQRGQIWLRGEQVAGEYLEEGSKATEDGWWPAGDYGSLDEEGYLFIEGRGPDTIIRGGENISAAEIEEALIAHPEVSAAAVVGLPDPEWGEAIAAAVVPVAGRQPDAEALGVWVKERLGSLKSPERIEFRDSLPETATGKILHRVLRDEFVARRSG